MRNFPLAARLMLALSPLAFTTTLAAEDNKPLVEAATPGEEAKPAPVWPFEESDVTSENPLV
jgi:zinc protease